MAATSSVCLILAAVICGAGADDERLSSQAPTPAALPPGDPRRCYGPRDKGLLRFEVLPGGGWDNLRNRDQGLILAVNYSQCRTTDDGKFLLPDGVHTIPVKSSRVETYAELFEHWSNYTSTLSRSVNVHAGLNLPHVGISGKFGDDYESVKQHQYFDRSTTTRVQARYVRYTAQLQPDSALHPTFKARLRKIAAHLLLNKTDLANYESQLVVRDFGTHVITSVDAGAALVQVDQLKSEYVRKLASEKNTVLASASASFFQVFSFGIDTSQTTSKTQVDTYLKSRTSSRIQTYGGPVFRPRNFTGDAWSREMENELVALDRSGDPIYYVVTSASLPDLPESVVQSVYDTLRDAVEVYYKHNTYRGCTQRDSPNFSFQANVNDGSCKPPNTNYTFGGVYQTCSGSGYTNLCSNMEQKNPLTGAFSCPTGYESIFLQEGTKSSSERRHECHRCYLVFHCCKDRTYTASATYKAYWCAAKGKVPENSGFLFGGLYTPQISNPLTSSHSCPAEFYSLRLLANLVVCVSDDYELGTQYALPFAGLYSCKSGNPLTLREKMSLQASSNNQKTLTSFMMESGPSGYPHSCPKGFSQHLALVDRGCEINYCVQAGALSPQGLPKVIRPPFMPSPHQYDMSIVSEDGLILTPDGTIWASMDDAESVVGKYMAQHGQQSPSIVEADVGKASEKSGGSTGSPLPTAAVVSISVLATLMCIVLASLAVMKYRKRSRLYRPSESGGERKSLLRPAQPLFGATSDNPDTITTHA